MLLGFAGFLRYDEFSALKFSDLKFYEDHLELFIRKSKTDQLRECNTVVTGHRANR